MLFDLSSGKRKRVVQVVYSILALLMGGSLVLFGIGSDAPGGILDALGIGGNSNTTSSPQYEQQIEDAEGELETDPENQQALLALVRYHYLSATSSGVTTDPQTGQLEITETARSDLESSVDAWQRYLALKPKTANAAAASSAAAAYRLLLDPSGAAEAQAVVAEAQNTSSAYAQLALYLYADFQFKAGDEAAKQAVATAEPAARAEVEKNLAQLAENARKQKKAADKAAEKGGKEAGEEQLSDPFGSLGGAGSTVPTTPAP